MTMGVGTITRELLLELKVERVEGDHIVVTCPEVPGLFIGTKSFKRSIEQIGPCLAALAYHGTKVPGIDNEFQTEEIKT